MNIFCTMKSIIRSILVLCLLSFSAAVFCPLQAQELLNYPLDTVNGVEVYRYQVEKSIGLYRVGVNFHVTQEEIIRWNPQLENRGLHYGETLLLPTGRPVVKETKPTVIETTVKEVAAQQEKEKPVEPTHVVAPIVVAPIVEETVQPAPAPAESTPAVDNTKFIQPIELALMLPFESQQTKQSGNAERMLEFYQGALIALNEMQNDSVHFRLRVFDTGRSERVVNELCDSTVLDQVQGVLGLVYPIQIERMAAWSAAHQVPLLVPFSAEEEIAQKPYVLQFNSMDKQQADSICAWIKTRDAHCVALEVRAADMSEYARTMRKQMQAHQIKYSAMALRDLLNDSVAYALDTEKENIILLHSDKYQHIRMLLPHLEKLQQAGYRIRIIGQYSWIKENITIPQVYTSMFTAKGNREAYDALWSTYFNTEHASDAPRYDLLGYDLMKALVAWIDNKKTFEGLQSSIRWTQIGEGGWQNNAVSIVEK